MARLVMAGLFLASIPEGVRGSVVLTRAARRIETELGERLGRLPGETELQVRIDGDGLTRIDATLRTRESLAAADREALANTIRSLVRSHLDGHYPGLELDPVGTIRIRPPFRLDREAAPLTTTFGPLAVRRPMVSPVPPPGDASAGAGADPPPAPATASRSPPARAPRSPPRIEVSPVAAAPPRGETPPGDAPRGGVSRELARETGPPRPAPGASGPGPLPACESPAAECERRIGTVLARRYRVDRLFAAAVEPGMFRVLAILRSPARGPVMDQARLNTAVSTLETAAALLPGFRSLAPGSEVIFHFDHPPGRGPGIPSRVAALTPAGWRVAAGSHLHNLPRPAPPPRAALDPRLAAPPAPPVAAGASEAAGATSRSPPPPVPGTSRPAGPPAGSRLPLRRSSRRDLDPVSHENLPLTPYPILPDRGLTVVRASARLRRLEPGNYTGLGEHRSFDTTISASFSPSDAYQYTLRFERLRQNFQLAGDAGIVEGRADSIQTSFKFQVGESFFDRGHLAMGADLLIGSRSDDPIRLPDDRVATDSFWVAGSYWVSPVWNALFSVRTSAAFTTEDSFTVLTLGSEYVAHRPLRRYYFELAFRDIGGERFETFGTRQREAPILNLGVEVATGREGSLILEYPHAFGAGRQEGRLTLLRRF